VAEVRPNPSALQEPAPLSGTIMGRFVVGERLGAGAMGEVYRAEDIRLKRTVALKRLAPYLRSDPVYRRRFQQESERASRFSDAHIAAVYDVIEEESEIFLVMEYIEGENLRQRMCRPMTMDEFFEIATQCAEALIGAHDRGIVHCDIKPENIMLTTSGQVKMLDFGVAKDLPRADQTTVDRNASMTGTPAYMSPEVLMERVPDGRADIFSLGVVFYEALTCHHPFIAGSFVATADRIRHESPAPLRIFNAGVPEALECVIERAMAKEPAQRYANARELLEDLRRVQAGLTPTKRSAVLPVPRPVTWRFTSVAALAFALLAGAGVGGYRWMHRPPVLTERGWVLISDFDTRGEDPISDSSVREGLTIALQQSRYVNVFPRTRAYDVLQRMKKQNVSRIDENLGREICQRENLQILLAGSVEHMGEAFRITVRALNPQNGNLLFAEEEHFNKKDEFFERADTLARAVRKDLGESLGAVETSSRPLAKVTTSSIEALQFYSKAKEAMDQGREEQAFPLLQSALQLDPNFAMAHLLLGQYHSSAVSKNQNALTELKRAYDLRGGVTDREQRWIEAAYYNVQERYDEAARALSALVSLYPDDPDAHLELSNALFYATGQTDGAITELQQTLKVDPYSARAYADLVLYLARRNAGEQAIEAFKEAQRHGVEYPRIHWALGLAYLGLGNIRNARGEFFNVAGSEGSSHSVGQLYLTRVDLYEGRFASARMALQQGIKADETVPAKGFQLVRRRLLGTLDLLLDDRPGAREQADLILHTPAADLQTEDLLTAGTLYARAGQAALAKRTLSTLESYTQQTTTAWNKSCYLNLKGEIALAEDKPPEALTAFQAAESEYSRALSHQGMARSYEAMGDWTRASQEWDQVLQRKGEILQVELPFDIAIAHLQSARAYAKSGNGGQAKDNYEKVLNLWKDGDDSPLRRVVAHEVKEVQLRVNNP
jgi:serine/threonine protein kinase/predicted Zn-dependent protease